MTLVSQLLNISSADPDDARRRKLLNIMLIGIGTLSVIALLFTLIFTITDPLIQQGGEIPPDTLLLLGGSGVMVVGIGVIFLINRYGSGTLASTLFLMLFTVLVAFSDTPDEVADGRALFAFAIPILMASVLLRPYASFVFAVLSSVVVFAVGVTASFAPNVSVLVGFISIALVSWLAARSLEQTLNQLRTINKELDQRVAQRTRDLAEALASVQAESSKNEAILESIADGVIVFDNHGKAMVANPAVESLLGVSARLIPGQSMDTLMKNAVSQNDRDHIMTRLDDPATTNAGTKFQWGRKTLSVSFARVNTSTGRSLGTVIVFRDFTKEAELDRMKSAFVSMASHELRTPLNAILGYTDMLTNEVYGPILDEQKDTLDRITANSKRLLSLVNNLLDQAAMEAGKVTLNITPFTIRELTNEVDSIMSVLASHKGLKFSCTIDKEVPAIINSDLQRLQQIVINLVGNAIKFTNRGSVDVHISRPTEDKWTIQVKDTGAGIPEDAQTYIFEPFRQVDDPITRENTGSGLGLSIVKMLTDLLGGEITLTSQVGKGSTFTITLPLSPVQEVVA